ncbi:hypothetical protein C8R44DRAFT_736854 [Mycena epipterygia]|nr:hypothetical protein C8R44DRAFT_736854 [Mycena epipterygia]
MTRMGRWDGRAGGKGRGQPVHGTDDGYRDDAALWHVSYILYPTSHARCPARRDDRWKIKKEREGQHSLLITQPASRLDVSVPWRWLARHAEEASVSVRSDTRTQDREYIWKETGHGHGGMQYEEDEQEDAPCREGSEARGMEDGASEGHGNMRGDIRTRRGGKRRGYGKPRRFGCDEEERMDTAA